MDDLGQGTLGKYELIEDIGRGGFATVFRARDTTLQREVALKVLDPLLFRDPVFVKRFHQEAVIAANLDHDNIVPVYEIAEAEHRHYIAMKLASGGSLARRIEREGPLPMDDVVQIISEVAAGLDRIHEHELVHRDVKPSNILIGDQGRAMLSDFGLVRAATGSRLSTSGFPIGTPAYMAPEQAEGEEVDARTDIYALGIVLYEMVTGQLPFSADSPAATLYQHVHKAPPRPSSVNPRVSSAIEQVILRALEKSPTARYQTARDLADDLSRALAGQMPVQPEPPPKPKSGGVSLVFRIGLAAVLLCVALLACVGIAMWQDWLPIFKEEMPTPISATPADTPSASAPIEPTTQPAATATPSSEPTETPTTHATDTLIPPSPTEKPTVTPTPTATSTPTPIPTATSVSSTAAAELAPAYEISMADGATQPGQGKLVVQYLRGDRQPIEDGRFRVYGQKQDLAGNWVQDDRISYGDTDSAGQVSFDLEPGAYILQSDIVGYNWGDAFDVKGKSNVTVEAGKVTTVRVVLARLIVGFAYGDGRPIDNQRVRIYTEKTDVAGRWVTDERVAYRDTDNTGTVAFNIAPGHYVIQSDLPGYNWGDAHDAEGLGHYPLPSGEETTLIQRLGKLVVGLVGPDGNAIEGRYVRVHFQAQDASGQTIADDQVSRNRTDNGGTTSFNLTPGLYAVEISDSYTYDVPIEAGRITRFDGSTFVVEEP